MKEGGSGRFSWIPNEAFGITDEEAQEWIQGFEQATDKEAWEHFTPEFVGTKAQTFNEETAYAHFDRGKRLYVESKVAQPEGRVIFKNNLPITVFAIGDVHLGSVYTDHNKFREDIEAISKTPGAYVIFMSNLIDNAIPSQYPVNMLSNTLPPDKQVIMMRRTIQRLDSQGKVLGATTSPCHEGWTYKHTGQDINAMLFGFEGRRFPVVENGGVLTIQFPDWERRVGLYHMTGPFESNFSPTHATKQMNRLRQNMDCDIVIGAHKHVGDAEDVYQGSGINRKQVAYIRSGTYKGIGELHDQFVVDRYGATGEPSGESVTILPTIKGMDSHLSIDIGLLAQEAYLAHHFA